MLIVGVVADIVGGGCCVGVVCGVVGGVVLLVDRFHLMLKCECV